MSEKIYCVKCNRNKPKGEWKQTDIKNSYVDVIPTIRGPRKMMRGFCSVCGSKATKLIKSNPGEQFGRNKPD